MLLDWCATQLAPLTGAALELVPVAGDASFRRYYRVRGCLPSRIAVHAPPDKERNDEFVSLSRLLRGVGVQAPEVLAHQREHGYLLLSDFGDELLLPALDANSVDALYANAMDTLARIQSTPLAIDGWTLPDYSPALLRQEMELFPHWFLERLLGMQLDTRERSGMQDVFAQLIASALQQPQVFVHRDFHSRNLMLLPAGELGVIDFQDAVRGPITYDLVSLLRDCYVAWPAHRVTQWATQYAGRAELAGHMAKVEPAVFLRWFDWMGLQRHIKVLGIFARLWLRDGKAAYLRDLPLVLHYTLQVCANYPQLAAFHHWLQERVVPLAVQQDWYQAP